MANVWKQCRVNRTGPAEEGTIFIHLKANDGAFNHWFKAYPLVKKEMLATALAAMSMSADVIVYLDGIDAYSQVLRLYVKSS